MRAFPLLCAGLASVALLLSHQTAAQPFPTDTRLSCPLGHIDNGNNCQLCPAGTFPDPDNPFACTKCPKGTSSAPFSFSRNDCTLCNRGTYGPFPGARCRPCPIDTFASEEGNIRCTPCPPGWTASIGASECVICPPGSFLDDRNSCERCPFGTETTEPNSRKCRPCRPGHFRNFRTPVCLPCNPGFHMPSPGAVRCKFCPIKTYQHLRGQTDCTRCPRFSRAGGRNSTRCFFTDCDNVPKADCLFCPPGQGRDPATRTCATCPPGTVSPTERTTECEECPGILMPNKARTKCICPPNAIIPFVTACELCPPGSLPNKSRKECVCKAPKILRLFTFQISRCVCPAGQKALGDDCVPCRPRDLVGDKDVCQVCEPLRGLDPSTGECTGCPSSTENFGYVFGKCNACPADRSNDLCLCPDGQITPFFGGSCEECPPGTRGDAFINRCFACNFNEFQPKRGQSECLKCPPGKVGNDDLTACVTGCPEGQFRSGDRCVCISGILVTTASGTKCEECPEGTEPDNDSLKCGCPWGTAGTPPVCKKCPPGTFSRGFEKCRPCFAGTASNKSGTAFCDTCEKFTPDRFATGSKTCLRPRCGPNRYPKGGKCLACPPGTRFLRFMCLPCPAGAVSQGGTQPFCTACKGGKRPDRKRRSCVAGSDCRAGNFIDGEDGGKCKPCPPGLFTRHMNARFCRVCSKGMFNNKSGSKKCFRCKNGTVNPRRGRTKCTKCGAGLVANAKRTACVSAE